MLQLYLESISSTIVSIFVTAQRFGCRNCQKRLVIAIRELLFSSVQFSLPAVNTTETFTIVIVIVLCVCVVVQL